MVGDEKGLEKVDKLFLLVPVLRRGACGGCHQFPDLFVQRGFLSVGIAQVPVDRSGGIHPDDIVHLMAVFKFTGFFPTEFPYSLGSCEGKQAEHFARKIPDDPALYLFPGFVFSVNQPGMTDQHGKRHAKEQKYANTFVQNREDKMMRSKLLLLLPDFKLNL